MKRSLMPLALACALVACGDDTPREKPAKPAPAATAPTSGEDPQAASGNTRVTVYSGDYQTLAAGHGGSETGYALVSRDLHFVLKAGRNSVAVKDLPQAIDVAATSLRPATSGVTVGAQRFLAPLAGAGQVFSRAIGRRVAVDHTSGGARQTDNGILVAAGDGLTLALSDGRYKVIREFDSISVLDSTDLPGAEPELRWQVQAEEGGAAGFRFDYPTGGLAWRAEYVGRLAGDTGEGCKLSLDGWALVANRSGTGFRNAALTLVAGEPNRVPEAQAKQMYAVREMAAAAPPAPMPVQRRSGEYHAYDMPGRTDLADGSIERVALFAPVQAVDCTRSYETHPAVSTWPQPRARIDPGFNNSTGPQPVTAVVAFDNSEQAGLGRALPEGRVRMFDGEDFLGESSLPHTPVGTDILLEVGRSFDLTAERERQSFRVDQAARTMTEAFRVTLANATDADATIHVREPMPRWSDWDIIDSSVPGTRSDAQNALFEVLVPANGEALLDYTVRYRWPASANP